jgi:O-antigen/teichoic acid export membrane protein
VDGYELFVKRIGLVGIATILVVLNSIIIIPILTKSLPVSDYGLWVQVNITYYLLTGFTTLGLPYTLVRFLAAEKDRKKIQEVFYSLLTLVVFASLITSLILIYFSKIISIGLFGGNTDVVIITSLIIFVGSLNLFFIDYFRAFGRMRIYSMILIIQSYLSLGLVTYFTLSGKGIATIVSGFLIAQILIALVAFPIIVSKIGLKIPKFSNIKEYLNFGLPTIPSNLSYWVVDSSDRYFIGFILGVTFVGYYSPGYVLGAAILIFYTPFSILLPSALPKYYDNGNLEEVNSLIKYSLKYFLLVAIPSVFALSLLSRPILIIISTPEIASNGYLVTPFVALSSLLIGTYGIITNYLLLKKKTKIIAGILTIAAFSSLLNIIFIPYLGIIGAAVVTLISYFVAFILGLRYTLRYFKIDFDYISTLKSTIASILMSVIIILINPHGILGVTIVIGASVIIYLGSMLLLKGIKQDEINFFKNMIK